jgi:DNA topoisomerase-2
MSVLKKSEKKKKGYTKIEGLDPANNAGGKLGYQCSLILCEGLSAKTYAVAGIQKGVYDKSGRDFFGVMPLSGKLLNCRNSIPTTIAKNKVITNLIQTLNLRHDLDYTEDNNYKTLSYGKVILLCDADVDGLHISGLLMNFFHYLFPSLLEREDPFVVSMCTPIVRVFNPKGDILFYDENKFREFAKEQERQNKTFKSKYYKGLGTTKPEDVPDTFGLKMVEYINDDNSTTNMNKIFHKKFADTRKDWLANYDPNPTFSLDDEGKIVDMEISSFLNTEVIKFSHNDCKRSIPCLFDGLKESQRKVLYAVKKRNLTYNKQSLKVAQLGGYVAEHTNYHHGEQNLFETIINMAQDYVGSNNIPLFYRDGMMGTRLVGGKDSASPRYIFTKMETLTPLIFREEDDILLEHVIDDGDVVEPKFYIPILPMILINGCLGIGTGWSSSIPCYNPLDIIECIKIWLDNDGEVLLKDPDDGTMLSMIPEIKPWYRGFEGTIEKSDKKYITYGVINKNKDKVEVTELPIGMWTDKFKETAEDWLVDKKIKSMKNYSTPKKVNFLITESDDGFSCNINNMGLYSYLHTSNMVLFNEKEQLKKYTVDEIINEFCIVRYQFYTKRKNHIISTIEKELRHLGNKERFIQEIIDGKLKIMNIDEEVIIKELEKRKYDKETKNDDTSEQVENKNGYNYLLKLPVRTLTADQVKKIKNDIQSLKTRLDNTKKICEKQMWLNDLKDFENEYHKWLKNMNENDSKNKKVNKKK